ncbi:MAG TPA: 2,3-bisphosphoglycerate-independent phosphoglycerate mutase [Candidatus Babeliales bacterium]|nr:2,3-bisphosphoglycerate-independent phosphoglycerate mutase [Candidatus Babeliales bacterium]
MEKKTLVLVILDGFGRSEQTNGNAIAHAEKPFFQMALEKYPHTLLAASGNAVGLAKGRIGNSEVGHLTIGAGRRIESDAVRIDTAIKNGKFFSNKMLVKALRKINKKNKLHIIGLVSNGRVHSDIKHLYALLKAAKENNIERVVIHAILDGRDVPQRSAEYFLNELEIWCKKNGIGTIGSLHGRFYAMDRDQHWDRTEQSYKILTEPQEIQFESWRAALEYYYAENISDEFVPPTQLKAMRTIEPDDGLIFFNFRPDRARQLTEPFVAQSFSHFSRSRVSLSFFITMTQYDKHNDTPFLFEQLEVKNTLKEVLSASGKKTCALAETEKYAHITYFFNGLKEEKLTNEMRVLIPSLGYRSYADAPCMSAPEITKRALEVLQENKYDFFLINYANADMVGHSGDFNATVKAIECLDDQLKKLWEGVKKAHGILCITGDHGNAEQMIDPETGHEQTSHTTNPVYFIAMNAEKEKIDVSCLKELADIAPWILNQMHIRLPKEMERKKIED